MPLVNIDISNQWTKDEERKILDSIHNAVVKSFEVPERDRYQLIHRHSLDEMVLEDTGLGFDRELGKEVVIHVTSRKRSEDKKVLFYQEVVRGLEETLGLDPKNVLITVIENGDADWSFGHGEAQFLTGDLS